MIGRNRAAGKTLTGRNRGLNESPLVNAASTVANPSRARNNGLAAVEQR